MNGTKKINHTLSLRHLAMVFPGLFRNIPQNTKLQQTNNPGLFQYIHFDKNNLVFCVNKNMIQLQPHSQGISSSPPWIERGYVR